MLITHKLREAMAIADDISVLRHGRVTWNGRRDDADVDLLVAGMLGESRSIVVNHGTHPHEGRTEFSPGPRAAVVRAEGLGIRDAQGVTRVKDATLEISSGEIVGVAGVEGSGARELLHAFAGRLRPSSGILHLPDAIGFIPEDRQHDALMLDESVAANVALRGAGRRRGWFSRRNMRGAAERLVRDYGILAPDVRAPVSTLSGGNQQRLVVARELDGNPSLLVAVNPTRGLDVAATAAIHDRLRNAASGWVWRLPTTRRTWTN